MPLSAPLPPLQGFAFHWLNLKPQNKLKAEPSHGFKGPPAQQPGLDQDTKTQPARSHCDNAHHHHHGQIPGGGKCYWKPPETCAGEMLIENRKPIV